MPLDLNELRELLTALNQTDIAELTLKSSDFELTVRRGLRGSAIPEDTAQATAGEAVSGVTVPALPVAPPAGSPPKAEPSAPIGQTTPPPTAERRFHEVKSPMVGTFYRAPAPDESPFVEVGDRIRPNQTVCIIEAMKLMNEIEAEVGGEIVEILVQNGQPVEFGQPLMRVIPS